MATLMLILVYLVELVTAHRQPTEMTSTLEPVFSLPGGYYDKDIRLEISTPDSDIGVLFTVDGSVPTHTTGTIYIQPIHLSAATPAVTVVRARAILPGDKLGPVVSASYFCGIPATLPMISLIVEPDDMWSQERGIYANAVKPGKAWERPVDITYVDRDRRSGFHIQAGVRIHGGISRLDAKKSLRFYFRQEYGASRLEYPLFANSDVLGYRRLLLHSGGQDGPMSNNNNWTLMRNSLIDRLALQLGGYAPHSRPALVFINGELWGIYQIRERIDRHFLTDHYGIQAADFLDTPEGLPGDIRTGDREHWDHLMHFAKTHDLADPVNYAYVQSQVDLENFIDYNILQIYVANTDWPTKNVYQFRPRVQGGRWHWIFWDTDHGFGAYPMLVHGGPDIDLVQLRGDMRLFRELRKNPEFLDQFLSRAAHLLNTTLTSQSVIAHIDALEAALEPDIAYEAIRWASSISWQSNVRELRDFARRRPDFVRRHMVKRFNLEGTAQLVFNAPASGSGHIAVDGDLVPSLPWQGVYFQGVPVQIMAAPAPGYRFAGWDPPALAQNPVITLTVNITQTITPRFEPMDRNAPRPGDVVLTRYRVQDDTVEENWFELLVTRPGGVDLCGWRITDNDTKTATDEGSLIFSDNPALANIPRGTTVRVILDPRHPSGSQEPHPLSVSAGEIGGRHLPQDDLAAWDRHVVLYVNNGNLTETDPGFSLGPNDNLVLLAPGPTARFTDDRGIAFAILQGGTQLAQVSNRTFAVTPASFGVLVDGVMMENQKGLGEAD